MDQEGRIRIDDWELDAGIQAAVLGAWADITTENLFALSDFAGFKQEFRSLFGFEVAGVDYSVPVDLDVPMI